MNEAHNYAMSMLVPLIGIAPLFMLFILKENKSSNRKKPI